MSSINSPQGSQRSGAGDARDALGDATRKTQDIARQAVGEAQKAATDLGEQGRRIAEDVSRSAQDAAEQVRREAQSLAEVAIKDARDVAEQGKGQMAAQIATVGAAIARAADDLEGHDQPVLAGYARRLGDGVQQVSHTLHEKGVEELVRMAGDFARRQPAAFIGGAALLGFVASRFAKASAHHADGPRMTDGGASRPLQGEPSIHEPWPISPAGGARRGQLGAGVPNGSTASVQPGRETY